MSAAEWDPPELIHYWPQAGNPIVACCGVPVSPPQVARAALRLADALDVVADEMGREDACQEIITAHLAAADDLCWAIVDEVPADSYPDGSHPEDISAVLTSPDGPVLSDLARWADAWRSWGETRRAEP